MNCLIILSLFVVAVVAAPGGYHAHSEGSGSSRSVKRPIVTSQYHSQDENGQYNFGYASSDGQARAEVKGEEGVVAGKYAFTSPEGYKYELAYTAGRDGVQAEADHLPQAPAALEVPEELKQAYAEAEARLAAAYEEARARGDDQEEKKAAAEEAKRRDGEAGGAGGDGGEEKKQESSGGEEQAKSEEGSSSKSGSGEYGVQYITIPIQYLKNAISAPTYSREGANRYYIAPKAVY